MFRKVISLGMISFMILSCGNSDPIDMRELSGIYVWSDENIIDSLIINTDSSYTHRVHDKKSGHYFSQSNHIYPEKAGIFYLVDYKFYEEAIGGYQIKPARSPSGRIYI